VLKGLTNPYRLWKLFGDTCENFFRFMKLSIFDRGPGGGQLLDGAAKLLRLKTIGIEPTQTIRKRLGLIEPAFDQRFFDLLAQGRADVSIQLAQAMIGAAVATDTNQLGGGAIQILTTQSRIDKLSGGFDQAGLCAGSAGTIVEDDRRFDFASQRQNILAIAAQRLRFFTIGQRLNGSIIFQMRFSALHELFHKLVDERLPAAMGAERIGLDEPIRLIEPAVAHRHLGLSHSHDQHGCTFAACWGN
jgi:hypothetical protein